MASKDIYARIAAFSFPANQEKTRYKNLSGDNMSGASKQ